MSIFAPRDREYKYKAFSFGAGVQSTALMLLIKHEPEKLLEAVGHLPEIAYFADTGAEPEATHNHLKKLQDYGLPLPLKIVNNGSILIGTLKSGEVTPKPTDRTFAPYYIKNPDGKKSMLTRKCTTDFKVTPIEKQMRLDAGYKKGQRIPALATSLWLGISIDEADRMKVNKTKWVQNIYPLIELGMDRQQCQDICIKYNMKAPKSRCFFCPYIRDWENFRRENPRDYQKAIDFDKSLREGRHPKLKGTPYIHERLMPLHEAIEFNIAERAKQHNGETPLFDDFGMECEGHCGV